MMRSRITAGLGLIAASSLAQQASAQQPGVTRTSLQRHDLSVPGREVIQVRVDIAPGVVFPRHSHPGEEIVYALEGSLEYRVDGQPPVTLKPGETLFIPLYWLTNTGVSASRLYWEYKGGFFNAKGVAIPVAVTVFPGEQYEAPRSWAERAYPRLIYYNKVDKGGHFAAWEEPWLFAAELRAAFRSLR
jgi:mannose-6-phosphate isomerase-like protein (cupin superfamily)